MIKVANNWKYHKKVELGNVTIHSKFCHEAVEYIVAARDSQAALCKRLVDNFYVAFPRSTLVLIETTPKCFNDLNNGDFFLMNGNGKQYLKINDVLIFNFEDKETEDVRNPDWASGANIKFLGVLVND